MDDVFKDKTPRRQVDEALTVNVYRFGILAGRAFLIVWGKRKGVCSDFVGIFDHA